MATPLLGHLLAYRPVDDDQPRPDQPERQEDLQVSGSSSSSQPHITPKAGVRKVKLDNPAAG